jgi:ElaB/YqjD/DUF883 family membrane-anchored ribosome-binding protein
MEGNYNDAAAGARTSGRKLQDDVGNGLHNVKTVASSEIKNLIADVEELMARISDLKDADVERVRGKVQRAVDSAKQSVADSTVNLRRRAQRAAGTADDYVRASPWQAVGVAALVGAVVGILATRRS